MESLPYVQQIFVYPIKSLDGHAVEVADVLPGGALQFDRRFALIDRQGRWINGKRCPQIVTLQARYSDDLHYVHLTHFRHKTETTFLLRADNHELCEYVGTVIGQPVQLIENVHGGFPDDDEASGPTLVSWASLHRTGEWFGGLAAEEMRQRVRPNIVIGNCPAFWEDRLAAAPGTEFLIGPVRFLGMRICRRCIVPSLQPGTAERWPGFETHFMRQRWQERPPWSPLSDEKSSYRLAINTLGLTTGEIRVGDKIVVENAHAP